ncbi:TPA: ead/Ea22-like family protein [Escherichia coli]|nr:ead/Ea22-like family protein [Escherichia coli]
MSKIDYQKLREIAEKTKIAGEAPVMPFDQRINALNDFMKHFSPDIALALLDELEAADNNLIDSECHVAELEEALRDKQALLEASEQRIAELESLAALQLTRKSLVVPDEMTPKQASRSYCGEVRGYRDGWNACRAAMLQAEPVSNSDELPLDYLQGHKDGLEWAAQQAEANHPQTGDWLYDDPIDLARAIRKGPDMPTVQGGNYPVTPDGWVMVPKELTQEMMRAVQIRSELGGYATSNLSGAYNMFSEFWNVAVSAAPKVDDL